MGHLPLSRCSAGLALLCIEARVRVRSERVLRHCFETAQNSSVSRPRCGDIASVCWPPDMCWGRCWSIGQLTSKPPEGPVGQGDRLGLADDVAVQFGMPVKVRMRVLLVSVKGN